MRSFTDPEPPPESAGDMPWRRITRADQHRHHVNLRQQMASVFPVIGENHVAMETGHSLGPFTSADGSAQVNVNHPNNPDRWDSIPLHLGYEPEHWFPNLIRHLHHPDTVSRMRNIMEGRIQNDVL